ncbi:MAG: histidinol-phosphate transaminase [Candidatus Hodarchaeaceae archaeon]|nr:histidinol-phosphate transaminase [Candidatus Hodarchaeaceae archaeon]
MLCSTAGYPLAREYDIKIPGAVNLASNENPYGPSPAVLRALKRELKLSGLYPDPRATKLKQAIGGYLGVGTDCIAIGNGSDELMDLVCKAFVDQGDRVLIPLPTFAMYELSCVPYGGKPVFYKLPNFEWCTDELARAAKNTKLVFLGRPNNPTGNCLSLDGLRELLKVGAIIVVDEAYVEFAEDSVAKLAAKRKNLIVLRTLSKAFGLAGLRVGYAVGNPETIKILERLRAPFNVNRLAQVAAVAALRDQRYMRRVVARIKNGRAYIRRELAKLGFKVLPSDANFLMVDVSPLEIDAPGLCDFLVKRKIFVRDLSDFRGAGPNYVRITVGTPQQNKRLVGALKKLKGGR